MMKGNRMDRERQNGRDAGRGGPGNGGRNAGGAGGNVEIPGTQALRPLNVPRPLRVRTGGGGRPHSLYLEGGFRRVQHILEIWQVDEEWWREPISRRYARLALDDGRVMTVYLDLLGQEWYLQGK